MRGAQICLRRRLVRLPWLNPRPRRVRAWFLKRLTSRLWSSVGKKLITGITGLALVGFLVGHLTGNLLILAGPEAFNHYAKFLHSLGHGAAVIVAEIALLGFFVFHAITGISIWLKKRKAAGGPGGGSGGGRYAVSGHAGGPSRKGVSSQNMIWTGLIILLFVVLHIVHFKFGPDASDGYVFVDSMGVEMRDLHALVIEEFQNPFIVGLYVISMLLLGLHLRHGVWSALQSIGLSNPKLTPVLYTVAGAFGLLLTFGFIMLPLIVLFAFDAPSAAAISELKGVSP